MHIGRQALDLASLGEVLPKGLLKDKVLHFGSCSVLHDHGDPNGLLTALGVKAMTGFTKDVDWFESLAFEILLFEALSYYKRPHAAHAYVLRHHGELAKRLGFVMVR